MSMSLPWMLLITAFAAAFATRVAGVIISGRIEPETPLFDWFACVGQALVGGLMARAILLPSTALADIQVEYRIIALAVAFIVFFLAGRKLLPSTFAGVVVLSALGFWQGL